MPVLHFATAARRFVGNSCKFSMLPCVTNWNGSLLKCNMRGGGKGLGMSEDDCDAFVRQGDGKE